ncbi:uncharacterized protein LOC143889655 [Tasmannia lanceolata]|uniref:uncharacterized protein LOC143889655 n=1 Tax=Tasmannia lanceolata TaxID=3420 RepID=UPI0040629691
MANPNVGSKFISVNLNKSYGKPPSSSANNSGFSGGNLGFSGGNRARSGNHGGGGGGGMVVLSRSRNSVSIGQQKSGPRLSVPPPLNLPSLRKEHEKFDPPGGSGNGGSTGSGSGHGSSTMGWTKPRLAELPEKDISVDRLGRMSVGDQRVSSPRDDREFTLYGSTESGARGGGVYMPPSARLGQPISASASTRAFVPVEKAVVLRGEDFPSLQATLPTISTLAQKQKDVLNQNQKLKSSEEMLDDNVATSHSRSSPFRMRPPMRSSRLTIENGLGEKGGLSHVSGGTVGQSRKEGGFLPGPMPVVRLSHTLDWADDERDTGLSLLDRDRDYGFSRSEAIRESEFDITRGGNGIPQRSVVHDFSDGRVSRDAEAGKVREALRGESYGRDVRIPSREGRDGNSWRAAPLAKTGFSAREVGVDKNVVGSRSFIVNREMNKDKYGDSPYRDSGRNDFSSTIGRTQDSRYMRRDSGYGSYGQNGNHVADNGRASEHNMGGHYGDHSKRNGSDVFQSSLMPKTSFSLGSKGLPVNDPILNFGRDKRSFSNSGKPYAEDAFAKDFSSSPVLDGRDPFTGGLFKKKKDVLKQEYFHDPVRESFEAELERVQKMQEQERQRIAEEQARALEFAQKEEEERQRVAREEEERRRRLEDEAREAAWRAEQERIEAVKRAEEQRMAREEERRKIFLEEERRKEAAKKKLLELEARIAQRQSEVTKDDKFSNVAGDERMLGPVQRDVQRVADVGDWEDGERMVERITSSASSDSSGLNRSFDTGSRPHSSRDGNSSFLDRGKHTNFWKRDVFESGNNSTFLPQDQENGYRSPRRDAFGGGKVFPRKEYYGGLGVTPARFASKGGMSEPHMLDDFPHPRGQRWNFSGDSDHYNRNTEIDPEFPENSMDKFGDIGWGQGRTRGSSHAPYAERLFHSSEPDEFPSFGRSRHSMRQPRVLPPPSLTPMHKSSFRADIEHSGSSYQHVARKNEHIMQGSYDSGYHENVGRPGIMAAVQENSISIPQEQTTEKNTPRCDSQSSLSVSSPPSSPTHLSHDDLDDSGDSPVLPAADDGEQIDLSDNERVVSTLEGGTTSIMIASTLESPGEDEEWAISNNDELQEQEEYDEEEDGYQEEDEVHEVDDDNLDLSQEFEGLHTEEENVTDKMGQLVLGFDEGVEVGIPSTDEFERNGEKKIGMQPVSAGIVTESKSFDGLVCNGESLEVENNFSEDIVDSSSKTISENSVVSTSLLPESVEPSSSGIPSQQPITSAVNLSLSSQSAPPIFSTVSSVPSQAELPPVNLQFGLFSGPPLIPSLVPAIQIGSIQMPLHLHPQVGPSLTQIHPSQPPFFQFGQLRYTPPISQGILPLAPQTMSFVQPTVSSHYSLNQKPGNSLHNEGVQGSSTQSPRPKDKMSSVTMEPKLVELSQENSSKELNALPVTASAGNKVTPSQNGTESSLIGENKTRSEPISQVTDQGRHYRNVKRNYRSLATNGDGPGQLHTEAQAFSSERGFVGSRAPGTISGGKGKRFIYTARNNSSRSFPVSEPSRIESSGFQRRARQNIRRTEFRVRENINRRQSDGLVSTAYYGQDEKASSNGKVTQTSVRSGVKKDPMLNKSSKPLDESDSNLTFGSYSSRVVNSESKMDKALGKESPSKQLMPVVDISGSGEGNLKSNGSSVEDVDVPLQSGIVRVFKQPGIETPSDEDDFIEVRSKRQMLNDRREQREKEIKAKSRVVKAARKPRSISQTTVVLSNSIKVPTALGDEMLRGVRNEAAVADGRGLNNGEVSAGFATSIASPPLPPIGTPAVNMDNQADIRSHSRTSPPMSSVPVPVISGGGMNLVPGLAFESKNAALDDVPIALSSWGNVHISQQVMSLTQTQLDEAMKPARFDTHVTPIGDHSSMVLDTGKQSASILSQDKSFSSSTSPLNSLLAGEKIQFGAVTSPTILQPSSRTVSNAIGPSGGSCSRSEVSTDHNFSAPGSDCTMFLDKEKIADECCDHLEDPEAEAAASAVAVAAISSDEPVGSACSASVLDTKSFGGADDAGLPSGVAGSGHLSSQSRSEESLTVALPADLSVETPSLSLWPPLPSPHNSSTPLLSPFHGAPPTHFPCYEMNPMLGGTIFAFGPHDDSASTQPQSQKNSTSRGGPPLGAWQQCHSGVDSFYGPPTGFSGPFISPPGGIQGPPHMVVYNHFAPVGQFGQVGLSFMGTTYIPSGKQPDWKHTPVSSAVSISEGDINNLNMVSGQRNPPGMPAVQHLAPGSPLMPMPSPLSMFDTSPFQSSTDIPVQARWSHIPATLHSVPLPMPPLQHVEGLPSQFNHGFSMESATGKRFHEPRSSMPPDSARNFSMTTESTTQFPDELGLVDPSNPATSHVSTTRPGSYNSSNANTNVQNIAKSSSRSTSANPSENGPVGNNTTSMSSAFRTQTVQPNPSSQHYLHPIGYTDQRVGGGGVSQKVSSGGEWPRRMGFQGRNQTSGTEKNIVAPKMKQIYVPKPSTSGTSTTL